MVLKEKQGESKEDGTDSRLKEKVLRRKEKHIEAAQVSGDGET